MVRTIKSMLLPESLQDPLNNAEVVFPILLEVSWAKVKFNSHNFCLLIFRSAWLYNVLQEISEGAKYKWPKIIGRNDSMSNFI